MLAKISSAIRWAALLSLASGCAASTTTTRLADGGHGTALERAAQVVSPEAAPMAAEIGPRNLSGVESVAVPIEGSDLVRGRATVLVEAPIDVVREHVTDYGSYAEYLPRQKRSQVLRRKRDGAYEVYFQWTALHGAFKVWIRGEMRPRKEGDVEIYESHILDSNVDDAAAAWRLRPLEDGRTEVSFELFLDPQFPMPDALLNRGIVKGAADVAKAFRDRVENR